MNIERRNFFFLSIGILLCLGIVLLILFVSSRERLLMVSFLNVGQGDAIFIEAPNGTQVLVDAGPDGGVVRELGSVMPFWDRTIDIIIPTHADKDHIGGFPEVLKRLRVSHIYDTTNTASTAIYEAYEKLRDAEDANIRTAFSGDTIILDKEHGVYLRILYPDQEMTDIERNDASTVMQLVYGDVEFMLTGDAGTMVEDYLVYMYEEFLESEVLKAGHHGSKTSTSELFLQYVDPEYVVISAGEDNGYGHPHEEVVEAIYESGAHMFETKHGTIRFATNGREVFVEQ